MAVFDRNAALVLDAVDMLAGKRAAFNLPEGIIYLDGNSLGPLTLRAKARIATVVEEEWGQGLIRSWNAAGWIDLPARVGDKIAKLIGARPGEVVAADSTSVNLFKLVTAAAQLRPERQVILSDRGNFPTDLYVVQGLAALLDRGYRLKLVNREELIGAIDGSVAVVTATQTDFRDGWLHDIGATTRAAHAAGALTVWDLSHSAGALPVDLTADGVDFAVGCGYKYLNGGPGAPAFLYVRTVWQPDVRPPLSGWMGHERPFEFVTDYHPAAGVGRNLCGTPAILGMSALDAALDVWDGVNLHLVRAKSQMLTESFINMVEARCGGAGVTLASPRRADQRGSQVSLRHPQAYAVMQALIARGVIGDFRAPDLMRFGFAPLYNRFVDVVDAVDILHDILTTRAFEAPAFRRRAAVT